jgi:hypothetical protein
VVNIFEKYSNLHIITYIIKYKQMTEKQKLEQASENAKKGDQEREKGNY